jgi:hypothetical protein
MQEKMKTKQLLTMIDKVLAEATSELNYQRHDGNKLRTEYWEGYTRAIKVVIQLLRGDS